MFATSGHARKACRGRRFGLILGLLCVAPSWSLAAEGGAEGSAPLPATTATPEVTAAPKIITRIEFSGNRVTQPRILLQEMVVKEGDIADPVQIERSRQSIMDLGLFKSVRVSQEPLGDGVLVRFLIKEKIYILPTPKLNRDDENKITPGFELKIDNFAGLNQELSFKYETDKAESKTDGQKINTYSASFNYPRVLGSPWVLGAEFSQTNSPAEYQVGSSFNLVPVPVTPPDPPDPIDSLYKKAARTAAVQASRWLNPLAQSRGWQLGSGLVWRRNSYEYIDGQQTPVFQNTQATGVSLLGQYVNVRDYLFSRSGEEYGYRGEFGSRLLGSDADYTRHELFYRKFLLLDGRPHENIDLQARLGLSNGDIFAEERSAYSLGGIRTLRGYASGSFTGDAFAVLNVQYLRPFFGYYPLRGVLFLDVGNAYQSVSSINLGRVQWDVGVGLRLRLKSFVKLDLRVDAAYSYETGKWKTTYGTKEIF